MINPIISLHSYWMLNGAIIVSYLITRTILCLPFFKKRVSQIQQLKFARFSFFIVVLAFFIEPPLAVMVAPSHHSNFQLEPILKNASNTFLQHHTMVSEQLSQMSSTHAGITINSILLFVIIIGIGFFLGKYINNIFVLKKLQKNSFCRHKINNVHILFDNSSEVPFCWSYFKNHFIVIPNSFLEKSEDMKLAIRHELQHIRQGDTGWLHFLTLINSFCFWNPFMKKWINWLDELQEYSCDESLVLRKGTWPVAYAQCLVNAASNMFKHKSHLTGVLGMLKASKSILYKRVNMLFNYSQNKTRKFSILLAYLISFFSAISSAYAFNGDPTFSPLSQQEIANIIKQSHLDSSFQISATPEVVSEINNIRSSDQARTYMLDSLKRMKQYQNTIKAVLNKKTMPSELIAVPLVESGYQPLEQSSNPAHAAGIWQIIPETATRFGLIINKKQDDRLNTSLSTNAALAYLNTTHSQYNDWKLAVIAYEYGEQETDKLIKKVGSHDSWTLARSSAAPANLSKFVSTLDATVIIMRNPSLISERG